LFKPKTLKFNLGSAVLRCIALAMCLFFDPGLIRAQQGNYNFNNFGNRSILLSGNVTGSVEDIALAYYNPARLTEVGDTRFEFNAKAYQLTTLKVSNVLGEDATPSSTNFNGVPSMAGGTFNLFGTRFAFSFLSRTRNNTSINYYSDFLTRDILEAFPDEEEYKIGLNFNSFVRDEWIGLTWAHKLNDRLSLGISGFGSSYKSEGRNTLEYTVLASSDNVAFLQTASSYRQRSYGLILKLGANYNLPFMDIGLNINLPYIEIINDGRFNFRNTIAGISPSDDQVIDYDFRDLDAKRREPFGVSLGAGIPVGKSKIHVNTDYVASQGGYQRIQVPDIDLGNGEPTLVSFREERRAVVNFGFGAEVFINEKLTTYGGFSTDFNSLEKRSSIFDFSGESDNGINIGADFIHSSAGIDWRASWATIVLGATFTSGSSSFISPLRPGDDGFESLETEPTNVNYSRWQFIIGLEFPFIEDKVKGLIKTDE